MNNIVGINMAAAATWNTYDYQSKSTQSPFQAILVHREALISNSIVLRQTPALQQKLQDYDMGQVRCMACLFTPQL